MTLNDVILELIIAGTFLFSALLTLVRSSISAANLQKSEEDNDVSLHELVLEVRQRSTQAAYSVTVLELLSLIAGVFLLSSYLWLSFASIAIESYGFLIVAVLAVSARVILAALGERYADKLLAFSIGIVRTAIFFTYPLTFILEKVSSFISGQQSDEEAREEMEDEITAIMDEAVQEGTLDADEYRILTNIMQFGEVTVKDVMTPRNVIFGMPAQVQIKDVVDRTELQTYSRFPICKDQSLDDVLGYCLTRDVFSAALHGQAETTLKSLMRDVHFIPENVRLDKALEEFLTRRQHLFIVVDEYGGVEGLITMEDVVETILGAEIVDEADRVVDMRQLASLRRDNRVAASRFGNVSSSESDVKAMN